MCEQTNKELQNQKENWVSRPLPTPFVHVETLNEWESPEAKAWVIEGKVFLIAHDAAFGRDVATFAWLYKPTCEKCKKVVNIRVHAG